jgi:hypothetical protein
VYRAVCARAHHDVPLRRCASVCFRSLGRGRLLVELANNAHEALGVLSASLAEVAKACRVALPARDTPAPTAFPSVYVYPSDVTSGEVEVAAAVEAMKAARAAADEAEARVSLAEQVVARELSTLESAAHRVDAHADRYRDLGWMDSTLGSVRDRLSAISSLSNGTPPLSNGAQLGSARGGVTPVPIALPHTTITHTGSLVPDCSLFSVCCAPRGGSMSCVMVPGTGGLCIRCAPVAICTRCYLHPLLSVPVAIRLVGERSRDMRAPTQTTASALAGSICGHHPSASSLFLPPNAPVCCVCCTR